ncbi:hypothetical protein EZV62_026003 [Acer yangbiense]|uniref:SGNH hydrolase-type esterase domain-containing protein n=1 Tax=Acer yangbiense TaxID=1000413 RepID=A0A5C7GZD3_9ROSI|nr:hypothetical protein EZV62_026003 [Acer yangbiense]
MVGPSRPQFVLFGSSIVQLSFSNGGWGSILSDADILLRGYYGWNSRRAVQVLDRVFPKDAATQPSLVIVYFGGNDSMGAHSSGLGPHVPLPEYVENMRKIALHLKSLSDSIRVIFLSCPPVDEVRVSQGASGIFSELVRTNDLCKSYSEACKELCHELDVKVVDLFTAIQQRDEWKTACFTAFPLKYFAIAHRIVSEILSDNNDKISMKNPLCLMKEEPWCYSSSSSPLLSSYSSDGVHLSAEGSKVVAAEILKVLKEAEWEPSLHWKSMPTEFAENSAYDLVAADGKTTLNPSDWTFHREIQWD